MDENFTEIYELIKGKITTSISKPIIICIDGRGGSGKSIITTKLLTNLKDSLLVELDCFPTKGGLYDRESIKNNFDFDWSEIEYDIAPITTKIEKSKAKIIIVEGCFSFKNLPWLNKDLLIWVEVDRETCFHRLMQREARKIDLPLKTIKLANISWQQSEDKYIQSFPPQNKAHVTVSS